MDTNERIKIIQKAKVKIQKYKLKVKIRKLNC